MSFQASAFPNLALAASAALAGKRRKWGEIAPESNAVAQPQASALPILPSSPPIPSLLLSKDSATQAAALRVQQLNQLFHPQTNIPRAVPASSPVPLPLSKPAIPLSKHAVPLPSAAAAAIAAALNKPKDNLNPNLNPTSPPAWLAGARWTREVEINDAPNRTFLSARDTHQEVNRDTADECE